MEFRTRIQLPKGKFSMNQEYPVVLMGSCFTEEIGKRLTQDKFSCEVNPFGVLYNPMSIQSGLRYLLSDNFFEENDLFYYQGLWHSWYHHSSFSSSEKEECLRLMNRRLSDARNSLQNASVLILTLGNNRCYRYLENGCVVGNCHKVPEKKFQIEDLSTNQIADCLSPEIDKLQILYPKCHILFTVSPIRYLKYGLHESMMGKANLLLAVNQLEQLYPSRVSYFPAFEILLDELRDYRFYAEDMVHPSQVAINYIYDCFKDCFMDSKGKEVAKEWREIEKGLNHKPFNPQSDTYRTFIRTLKEKIEKIQQKYPYISVQKEIELCNTILN